MAIGTGSAVENFDAQSLAITTSASIADGGFSSTAMATAITNSENCMVAAAVFQGTFAANPSGVVNLYARKLNVQSANSENTPDGNNTGGYVGSFPLDAGQTAQVVAIEIPLQNIGASQQYEFYISNDGVASLNSGATVHVTPKAVVPKA